MDTRQPATKDKRNRESNNENLVQHNGVETEGQANESSMNKRRKQETDPLKMGHILEKVFSFLDANSIKAARQVNLLWSVEGAKSLIAKCYVKIPWRLRYRELENKKNTKRNFKSFLSDKLKVFPGIPNIIIGAAADVKLWKSFGVLRQVKSFKLKPKNEQARLLQKLLIHLPNLKYLNLEESNLYWDYSGIIKSITASMSRRQGYGSSLVISRIYIGPNTYAGLAVLEMLSDCKNVMIEDLMVQLEPDSFTHAPNFDAQIINMLGELLSTSQNVLKTLTLYNFDHNLKLLEFPCMTALTRMNLWFMAYPAAPLSSYKFSPSFRFSENVPNLQEININYSNNIPEFFQNLLENTGPAPSVKRVNCTASFMDNGVNIRLKTFPNTEKLEVGMSGNSELESIFRSLWENGKNLKELNLHIDCRPVMGNFPDLDCLLTGFDAETVNKIKETPNLDPFTLEELEKLRVNPSISNLKELEQLSICFYYDQATNVPNRMLTVAAKYEINRLPKNPRIFIMIQGTEGHKSAFEEVSKLPNFTVQFRG